MQARHSALLLDKLERVIDIGVAEITQNQLAMWFDQNRISHITWRTIHEHWMDLLKNTKSAVEGDRESKLLVGDANNTWVFVYGRGLTVSDQSWLKDIRSFGRIAFDPTNGANE